MRNQHGRVTNIVALFTPGVTRRMSRHPYNCEIQHLQVTSPGGMMKLYSGGNTGGMAKASTIRMPSGNALVTNMSVHIACIIDSGVHNVLPNHA